jgi:hypothetical protein
MRSLNEVPFRARAAQGCPVFDDFRRYVEDVRTARLALASYCPGPPERSRITAALIAAATKCLQDAIAVAARPADDTRPVLDWRVSWDPALRAPAIVHATDCTLKAAVPAHWLLARVRAHRDARRVFRRTLSARAQPLTVPYVLRRTARELPSARRAAGRRPLWALARCQYLPPLLPSRAAEVAREQRRQADLRRARAEARRLPKHAFPVWERTRCGVPYYAQLVRDSHGGLFVRYWCAERVLHRTRRIALLCSTSVLRWRRHRRWALVRRIVGRERRWQLWAGRDRSRAGLIATYRVRPSRSALAASLRYWRRFRRWAHNEPRLGWRQWDVTDDGRLVSPWQGTVWPGPYLAAEGWNARDADVRGVAGIHAYPLEWHDWRYDTRADREDHVRGLVLAEGEVVRGPEGWRAQAARILALHVPEPLAAIAPRLAQRYRVPVTVE